MNTERLQIGYVTGNEEKFVTVNRVLPEHDLFHLPPLVDEKFAAENVFMDRHRYRGVSEAKAFRDISAVHSLTAGRIGAIEFWLEHGRRDIEVQGGHHIALYSDCIQYLPETNNMPLEKPKTVEDWRRQVLSQSNQKIEICVGHTAILLEGRYPYVSSGIRTTVWTEVLTETDLPRMVELMGWPKLLETSGGLPIAAHEFFRRDFPLVVDYYPRLLGPGFRLEERRRWDDLPREELARYNTGAFPNVLRGMLGALLHQPA